ncbi:MAG: hypothetical protein EBU52_13380 [Cytophagia bacterium]|nr:hypothetical protein [Cytophagia bacterium]
MTGLINIGIQRNSSNINQPLPVVLFNANDFLSGYAQSLKGLIPTSISTIAENEVNSGNIKFRYQQGIFVDFLIASCNEIPLTTLVQNTYTSKIKIKNLEYTLNDVSFAPRQYLQKINLINGGILGKKISDSFTPNMYRNDIQKIQDSIDIPLNLDITPSNGIALFMISDALSINLSLTIEY